MITARLIFTACCRADECLASLNHCELNMKLDIFVPYWGDPALLRETVNSVLAQDCDDWFLTVLDDAYPDASVAQWFAQLNHPRVTYIRNEKNAGIVGNYRKCLASATHELVMLLGCDDVLLPNYVRTVLGAHARFPQAGIIQPGTKVIDENGRDVFTLPDWAKKKVVMPAVARTAVLTGEALATSLLNGDWLYWPSLTFRSDRLAKVDFNADLKITHDLAFVMDLIFLGESMVIEPEVCFAYRRHSKSASTASLFDGRRFADERRYFAIAQQQARQLGWHKAERAARWHYTSRLNALWIAVNAVFKGKFQAAGLLMQHVFNRA